ncbi:MAG: glycosyltransferase family 2 protein [Chloroflexi bacterium]|nr:glycosyltransferase family 2 protein [Chloroflexota bacterium]
MTVPAFQPAPQAPDEAPATLAHSVIIPVYNEEGNLTPLHQAITAIMDATAGGYEMVFVDDGSRDGGFQELAALAARDPRVKVVQLRRNFGQTPAIAAGIDHARGDILIFLDADLQNDPADIPRLLATLAEGYDVVSGWRQHRRDTWLTRQMPSMAANWLISAITGVRLRDYGCSLKAYRREVLSQVHLYGEMHRFIPAYASWVGAAITEIPVTHHPRLRGKSKYGLSRTVKVLLDLLTAKFLASYATKPIYVFGGVGLFLGLLAFLSLAAAIIQKFTIGVSLIQTPLTTLAAILGATGFIAILQGLNAEVALRTYHESQQKPTYTVRRILNGAPPRPAARRDRPPLPLT